MYYVYSNIRTYSSPEKHLYPINRVSVSADIFLILYPGHRIPGLGHYNWLLIYVERPVKYAIANIQNIIHLHLHGFIN